MQISKWEWFRKEKAWLLFRARAAFVLVVILILETVVSMESDSDGAALVLQQCNDIIRLQEELCNSLQEKV